MTAAGVVNGVSTIAGTAIAGIVLGGTLAAATLPRLLVTREAPPYGGLVGSCASTAGLASGVLALRFDGVELLAFVLLACAGVVAAAIDVVERRLPRQLVVPGLSLLVGLLAVEAAATGGWSNFGTALAASAVIGLAHLAVALASNGGLGSGDVTFGALLGMATGWLGWPVVLTGTAVAWAAAATALLVLRCVGRRPRAIPMGPFLLSGALVALLSA